MKSAKEYLAELDGWPTPGAIEYLINKVIADQEDYYVERIASLEEEIAGLQKHREDSTDDAD